MIKAQLTDLRRVMQNEEIAAYIIPLSDPHQSEYPASHWKSLAWISGFTGSAGTVLIAQDHAGLWTDSRYFIQGEKELENNPFELHKMVKQHHPGYIDWCLKHLPSGSTVAVDGPMFSIAQRDAYKKTLLTKGINLKLTSDLVGKVWSSRPEIPLDQVFQHDIKYAGLSRLDKLKAVREKMAEQEVTHHLITTLDDIAWLLNLRGQDVECNPVFVSYCVIEPEKTILFINKEKVNPQLTTTLAQDGVTLMPYDSLTQYLSQLGAEDNVLIHKATLNVEMYEALSKAKKVPGQLISRHLKAVKNDTEQAHCRTVHIKDGIALAHAFYWLENTTKERTVTEFEFANKLKECRATQRDFFGESFSSIVGYKGNGAIIHYRPEEATSAAIAHEGILLVDSGGQYLDGTTDITRTISFTPPPPEQKEAYTRVLKGHIALATAVFPQGTTGGQLDTLARHSLWQKGMNYGHGTGHGVGFFLNVHEPPQGFAPGIAGRASSVQKAGMLTSNEPGHYVTDSYGIRIENLMITQPADVEGFLKFETVTYFPIATNLIEFSLMTKSEVQWLNDYHQLVKDKLCPQLDGELKDWMEAKCVAV